MPDPILTNLISSALYDATRFGLDKALKKDIEHLFQQALKDCSREYKPEVAGRLRNVFKRKELKEKLLRFQEWGELIPEAAFVEAFSKILGGAGNAREFVEEFFQHFSARLAGHNKLFRQVVLGYQRNLLAGQGELRAQLQTHDQASQEGQARILQLLEDLIARIDPSLLREDTAEATIGYQEIPPLPPAYVPPETALQALRTRLQQRSVALVYGPPGAGKSVIATALAREAEAAGRPVFWFRFQRLLTDRKAVERSLLGFLKQETQHPTSNIQHLLSKSRALLIFDDLQYVADEELQKFLHLVAALAAERDPARGSLIFTSREKADYLPNAKLSELPVAGLAEAEAAALLQAQGQLDLEPAQQRAVLQLLGGHPLYLEFFRLWHQLEQPDAARLADYLKHAPREDRQLQTHLVDELYKALGGAESAENRLLTAVAFFRVPETREFVEALYRELGGKYFADTLDTVHNRRHLVQYLSDRKRYNVHDVLRDFYYGRLDREKKVSLHAYSAALYKQWNEQEEDLINSIEGSHHYLKSGDHHAAAEMIDPVAFRCIEYGYFWKELKHITERLNAYRIKDDKLRHRILDDLATLCSKMGEWDKAIEYYLQSLEYKKTTVDIHGMAQTYNNLGVVYLDKGEWDKAIRYFQQSLELFERLGDKYRITAIYNNLGIVYMNRGEWDKAIEYFKKSLQKKENLGDMLGIAQTYNNIGLVHQSTGEWDKAIEYHQKSLKEFKRIGNTYRLVQTYHNLGEGYRLKGEWDKAIEYFKKSLEGSEQVGDLHGMTQSYNNLGLAYHSQGKWIEAIEYYQKSLKGKKLLGDVLGIANTYINFGTSYLSKGEWDKAIHHFQLSLELSERLGNVHGIAKGYMGIGSVYQMRSEWDKAIKYYQKSLGKLEQLGDLPNIASTCNNIGLIYKSKDELDQAIRYFKRSLEISERLDDAHGMAQTYLGIGLVYRRTGEWDKALHYYKKSLEITKRLGDMHRMTQTYVNLGNLYRLRSEWDNAIEYYQQSLGGFERLGDVHGMAQTYVNLYATKFAQGKHSEAVTKMLEALLFFLAMDDNSNANITQRIIANFAIELGEKQLNAFIHLAFKEIVQNGITWAHFSIMSGEKASKIIAELFK
ncbi:MAG: tetratricopeptide repeat protein [Calditrichaeota bacterium]|nr:tetratricopeptide repeat protein [Calditrichota bacterium]